jgi:hypothetical protein
MTRETYSGGYDDLEELRKRFADFRSKHPPRTHFPEELWHAAAEMARRRGVNPVCRCLRLDANSLKKWLGERAGETQPKPAIKKHASIAPAAFVELLTPMSGAAASCIVEVESPRGGKLRLELKGIATSEIAQLIHTFAGQ